MPSVPDGPWNCPSCRAAHNDVIHTQAEGYELILEPSFFTGYKNVAFSRMPPWTEGKFITWKGKSYFVGGNLLGAFDTAIEAAVCYAKYVHNLRQGFDMLGKEDAALATVATAAPAAVPMRASASALVPTPVLAPEPPPVPAPASSLLASSALKLAITLNDNEEASAVKVEDIAAKAHTDMEQAAAMATAAAAAATEAVAATALPASVSAPAPPPATMPVLGPSPAPTPDSAPKNTKPSTSAPAERLTNLELCLGLEPVDQRPAKRIEELERQLEIAHPVTGFRARIDALVAKANEQGWL